MHWKGLRLGALYDSESKRNLAEPQSRHSEQLARPTLSATNLPPRISESSARSPHYAGPDDDDQGESEQENHGAPAAGNTSLKSKVPNALHSTRDPLNRRGNRFSLMRLRHASDPQLSRSYAKAEADAPPVPSIPPPTIITTAPTSHELDQPIKRKNKFSIFPDSRKSMETLPEQRPVRNDQAKQSQDSTGSQSADTSLTASRISTEEPGRLSTTSIRSGGRDRPNGSHRSSVVDVRFSESSRSDQSAGNNNDISRTNSPIGGTGAGTKRFRMPRLKRNRVQFPLPPKPTADDGQVPALTQSRSVPDGPTRRSDASDAQDHISPMPSPSRSSAGLSASRPPFARNDSTNSAHSAHSSPSVRDGLNRRLSTKRARSSTLDSVTNMRDTEPQPSPNQPSSGRTSFSTTGRKSFGDIFGITQRLRQNSEPGYFRTNSSPSGTKAAPSPLTKVMSYPKREDGDTPATYLARLEETIPKSTIAGVLSQSGEDFYKNALRKFMRGFSFFGDPIDMSIRKLLMEVELPKETQQIDRFLQSFADRYHECNPGIFASTDQAYFIAFSILILHTDVFNKNNKRKMQKGDYVKNTRGEGVAEDVLECFYENISYTPFIRIEDSNHSTRHLAKPKKALFRVPSAENLSRASRGEPVDPYALIMDGKLDSLRPSLKDVMNLEDPYGCNPTTGPADIDSLHRAFAQSAILQIVSARSRPDAFMPASMENPADSNPGLVDIKVAKVGLLWRKDPKKKKARSPWQEWGAILTLSHLYFFKDVNWVKSLMAQVETHQKEGRRRAVVFKPPLNNFNPVAMMSTDHAVALLDFSYKKHKHAFLFVRPNSLEEVFLANNETDMNDWLAKLNYAAAFRTTGVGAKGMMTKYDAQRNRMSRRPSFQSEMSRFSLDKEPTSPSSDVGAAEEFMMARTKLIQQKIREANETLFITQKQLDDILRNARHLQVLTPVHTRAREQLIMAAGRMSAKLKWVRQDIWRTKSHREVLVRDLGEDNDQAGVAPEPQRLRLEIPASNSLSGNGGEAVWDKQLSPMIAKSPSIAPENSPSIPQMSSPSSSVGGVRRPSLATSVTSPDVMLRAGRPPSVDNFNERTKSVSPNPPHPLEREASVLSSGSKMDVSSLASKTSKLTLPGSLDDGEERLLREVGLLDSNKSSSRKGSVTVDGVDAESKEDAPEGSQDRMSRVRHSFHRTLRDSSGGHHYPRSRKRDSTPSVTAIEDNQGSSESGGLSRKGGSFTVHGKKASIVTFGSDWQNMPPEERLKLRKPTPFEEPRASDTDLVSGGESTRSGHRASLDIPLRLSEEKVEDRLDTRSVLSESAVSTASHEPVSPSTIIHEGVPSVAVQQSPVDEPPTPKLPQAIHA
ncbi:hypothetical protein BDW74DRAFT_49694 [Aspergillus multicolor]|uniref:Arf family guanine nucleotide exchange factor SYT1 n=1 Tax=Aspergillus multicolor TaxID=41759 RepID=UPI003CCE0BA5